MCVCVILDLVSRYMRPKGHSSGGGLFCMTIILSQTDIPVPLVIKQVHISNRSM